MKLPKITQDFITKMKDDAKKGAYRIELDGISIDVYEYVFPPSSPFSESTHTVYEQFGDLSGKKVLDMGTGTGILAIQAALAGAESVDAIDICGKSIECAIHNVKINGLENKVKVYWSNLFRMVPREKKYDLIISNPPILDLDPDENITDEKGIPLCDDSRFVSLIDPGFRYHKELFREVPKYLNPNGRIVLCHADLQEDGFEKLEKIASEAGFEFGVLQSVSSLGYEWRNYEFFLK